jgi:hypothetical protein
MQTQNKAESSSGKEDHNIGHIDKLREYSNKFLPSSVYGKKLMNHQEEVQESVDDEFGHTKKYY